MMKATHIAEAQQLTVKKDSVVLIFDPQEVALATHMCEYIANTLELSGYKMDELWEFARKVRIYEQQH